MPTETTYRNRVGAVQAALRDAGIDILVTSGVDARRFLAGVDGLHGIRPIWLLIPQASDPEFVSPRLETEEIEAQSWVPVTYEWVEWEDGKGTARTHTEALQRALAQLPPQGRIGVDFYQAPASQVEALRAYFGAERIVDATQLLLAARLIRDEEVIDVVRRSGAVAVAQYEAVRAALRPGMTEWELAVISREAGATKAASFWNGHEGYSPLIPGAHVIASGKARGSRAHGLAAGRVIEDGDLVEVCFCGTPFLGHSIGFDRPLVAGTKPLDEASRNIVRLAERAQAAALATVRAGVRAADVHAAAFDIIAGAGFIDALRHRTGRGLGSAEVEFPELKEGDNTVLQPGMIFAVEPGVYANGIAGARFGDSVVVTEDGYEALTPIDIGHDI